MTSLYLCYQSITEPLTQTQVAPYLEGLARAGYRMVLLTFEPRPLTAEETSVWRDRLSKKGIHWHWCRYHKWPSVPATAYDVLVGILVGFRLARRYRVRLFHARAHVPGLMALVLKKVLRAKLLFDVRGFMAEEYVDSGRWKKNGRLFRTTKRVERALVRAADGIITLTRAGRELLETWYPRETKGKFFQVIPCCVDFRQSQPHPPLPAPTKGTAEPRLVYVGKLGGSYPIEHMVGFFAAARKQIPHLQWEVWTQSDPGALRELIRRQGLESCVAIGNSPPAEIVERIRGSSAAICLYERTLSAPGVSPTKAGEYLAAGIPVVCSAGVGDMDELLSSQAGSTCPPVGVTVRGFGEAAYQQAVSELLPIMENPLVPARCRFVAEENFDLERIGWVRYTQLYQDLIGPPESVRATNL